MANNLDSGYWGPEDLKRFLDNNGKRIVLFTALLLVVIAGSRSYFRWKPMRRRSFCVWVYPRA